MILITLETMEPLHGYGIARRIEQTSGSRLAVKYGTLYPALLKLELAGYVTSEWALTETRREAKFYRLTQAGRRKIKEASRSWQETADILARFLAAYRRSS
jgi:PadR family transcriptional regulator PadR